MPTDDVRAEAIEAASAALAVVGKPGRRDRNRAHIAVATAIPVLAKSLRSLHRRTPVYEPCMTGGCERPDCEESTTGGEYLHISDLVHHGCYQCRYDDGEMAQWPCKTTALLDQMEADRG